MFIQAASLLPAPWRGPGAGAGASSLGSECDVRRVVAYMREYSYDGVFDMESMAALDVANRIRSLAAPTFGILTGGGAAAAAAAAGPSCRWSLLKMTVALRIVATAAAGVPSMGAGARGACVLAWNAITSLLTD